MGVFHLPPNMTMGDTSRDGDEAEKLKKKLQVREKVAKEIVSTEVTYCNSLETIVKLYLEPSEQFLKRVYVVEIFSNIDQLWQLHQPILEEMQASVENWTDESVLASVFLNLVPFLKLYRAYCANYNTASTRVEERMNSSSRFASLHSSAKEQTGFDLCSLLIQPIQRIPRYRLLFEELLKHTPVDHPDYKPTCKTLESIQGVATFVNESVRAKENQDKLAQIQQSLTGSKIPPIVDPDRIFLREGVLVKMCRREPKRRYFFLFNDLLVYTTVNSEDAKNQTYTFHRAIGLSQVRVEDIPDSSGLANAFQIMSNQKSFSVFAESPQDKQIWMTEINRAIQLCYKLKHKQATGQEMDPDEIAPVWIPDKLLKNCMLCDAKFTTINRRHHCRKCGKLVCGSCSSKKYKLENMGKVCRVCDMCYDILDGGAPDPKRESGAGRAQTMKALTSAPSLFDTAEAQEMLNRRATKMFRSDKIDAKTIYLPQYEAPTPEPEEEKPNGSQSARGSSSGSSQGRHRKKKKKKGRHGTLRSKRSSSSRITVVEDDETADDSEDSEPNFPPPQPPMPSFNSEGFFEFSSEEEDSCEDFPEPPSHAPPQAPIKAR